MLAFGRADTPGERADAADRAGVAVAAHQGEAGQRNTEFGRNDVDDALPPVVHIEKVEAVVARPAPRGADHVDAFGAGGILVAAPWHRIDDMVDDGENLLGMGRRAAGSLELAHRDAAAHLMQEEAVDAEERRILAEIGDDVIVPNLLEERQRRSHGLLPQQIEHVDTVRGRKRMKIKNGMGRIPIMAAAKSMARRFRDLVENGEPHVLPGAFSSQCAKIAEAAGFKGIGVSGYSLSATLLGQPDVGLTTSSEVGQFTGYICDAVKIPVLADADTGFGNAINVMRTTEQLIKAGVGGL